MTMAERVAALNRKFGGNTSAPDDKPKAAAVIQKGEVSADAKGDVGTTMTMAERVAALNKKFAGVSDDKPKQAVVQKGEVSADAKGDTGV